MTYGYNAMPDYAAQLAPADRWAVAAYIRALQLSQAAKVEDVPTGVQLKSLKEIAREKHLPESFAEPWAMPSVNPADSAITSSASNPATAAAK
jgi:hypothetical protein